MKKNFADETTTLEVVLLPPSLRAELRRLQGIEEALNNTAADPIITGVSVIYASLIAATPAGNLTINEKAVNWPPSLDDCLDMSRAAFDWWAEQVYEQNPGWKPYSGDAEQEKKDSSSSGTEPQTELSS